MGTRVIGLYAATDPLRSGPYNSLNLCVNRFGPAAERFMHLEHDYADRSVSIDFFIVSSWINEPRGIEGQQLRWVETRLLAEHDLLPADSCRTACSFLRSGPITL